MRSWHLLAHQSSIVEVALYSFKFVVLNHDPHDRATDLLLVQSSDENYSDGSAGSQRPDFGMEAASVISTGWTIRWSASRVRIPSVPRMEPYNRTMKVKNIATDHRTKTKATLAR